MYEQQGMYEGPQVSMGTLRMNSATPPPAVHQQRRGQLITLDDLVPAGPFIASAFQVEDWD